ncbi:MAG: hypothetical protein JNK90_22685 [Planctomycetaceae bacterium]|nr:hypothetical protein [Planctomycetaceae bacterium]MBN8601213.1 hypothetical protein [Planctomycetota bacterium]
MRWWLLPVVVPFLFSSPQYVKAQEKTVAPAENKEKAKEEELKFLRVFRENKKPVALQTAIAKYKLKTAAQPVVEVDLVGAVHIGEGAYYEELNRRFATYDAVLYELVADPETRIPEKGGEGQIANPIGAMQYGMKEMLKLDFQLEGIDYRKKNFVHADMTPKEMSDSMRERGDGLMTLMMRAMGSGMAQQAAGQSTGELDMLTAMFSKNRPLALRRAMAKNFESMEIQMAGLADKDGKSTLITERNAKAFVVLDKELAKGTKRVAIFYGAGHLADMHERLLKNYQATFEGIEWINAWNLKEL